MRKLSCIALLALAACNHTQAGVKIQRVEVPVPQPCLPLDQIPAEPPRVADQLTGNAAVDLPIVAASALLLRAWGQELAAAHRACASGVTAKSG